MYRMSADKTKSNNTKQANVRNKEKCFSIYAVKTGQFRHRSLSLLVLRSYVRILNGHKYKP